MDQRRTGDDRADTCAEWVVLARPGPPSGPGRAPSFRRVLLPAGLAALVIAVVVAVGGLLVSQHIAAEQSVHSVAELTDDLAVGVVQPALTDAMTTDPAAARTALGPLVRHWFGAESQMVRVKVWTPDGTILYSDETRLIGQAFPLDADARAAFAAPRLEADVTDLSRPENRYERGQGKLLEVYRPVWTPGGRPLLLETYFRYDSVSQRSQQIWHGFAGVMLSSLLALLLLLGAGGGLLAVRARRAGARHEALLRQALDASDAERRRIAASLHDGVVQQLVAASFTAAGQAERARAAGDPPLAADLDTVASAVRDGIAGLRSLLVDIYPPSLHAAGLASTLRDLADAASRGGGPVPEIDAVLDDQVADAVSAEERETMFRIAQEAVHNAVRHGRARHLTLRLGSGDEGGCALEVADDGDGFDAARVTAGGVDGHFGLRLMTEAARHGGGWLGIKSAPGAGTLVRYEAVAR